GARGDGRPPGLRPGRVYDRGADPGRRRPDGGLLMATPAELFDLTGRVAVVTGASSGLGDGFARTLSDAGATVVAAARRADRLASLAADLPGLVPVECDVTVPADRERLVSVASEINGGVDVL